MSEELSFSERYGYRPSPQESPITIRDEAPRLVREGVLSIAIKSGFDSHRLRVVICRVLDEIPDEAHNWGASNVLNECKELINSCEWFEVYDICETLAKDDESLDGRFTLNLNNYFIKKGVGWKMEDGRLSVRGEEDYEKVTTEAQTILKKSKKPTAAEELKEAMGDLSRRPNPDITGAIQHSMASLECLAREISGSQKTLGAFIKDLNLPSPVDGAVEKMWGFASNQGRHVKEGKTPKFAEAMLTVHFCSALIVYLSQKE